MHDIDSTRRSVDLANSSKVDDPQASLGSFVNGAQEDGGANQERQPLSQSYESYQPMGKQELDSIADLYALLLAGLVERERALRVEETNMQNFFYLQETLVFSQDRSYNLRERCAQTLDQFDSRYEFAEFPVRIYYDTCSSQSADHYSGTYVDAEGSHFRRQSQSTCLDVEFGSWA